MRDPDDSEVDAPEPADEDAGEQPIHLLASLGEEPPAGFSAKVLNSIHRRETGGHLAGLAWFGLTSFALELLHVVTGLFTSGKANQGDPDHER